jgi:hypothetical protein
VDEAVRAENEACEKIAEDADDTYAPDDIAAEIRARREGRG